MKKIIVLLSFGLFSCNEVANTDNSSYIVFSKKITEYKIRNSGKLVVNDYDILVFNHYIPHYQKILDSIAKSLNSANFTASFYYKYTINDSMWYNYIGEIYDKDIYMTKSLGYMKGDTNKKYLVIETIDNSDIEASYKPKF